MFQFCVISILLYFNGSHPDITYLRTLVFVLESKEKVCWQ